MKYFYDQTKRFEIVKNDGVYCRSIDENGFIENWAVVSCSRITTSLLEVGDKLELVSVNPLSQEYGKLWHGNTNKFNSHYLTVVITAIEDWD